MKDSLADFDNWHAAARAELDAKAKPAGSLGTLEDLACRLAALQGTLAPTVGRATLLVFGADHGIAAERPAVSAFPRAVTLPVFQAVARGQAASSVLCASAGCRLLAVDVGIDGEMGELVPEPGRGEHIEVLSRKVRPAGSCSMLRGPAVSEEELWRALDVGAEAVRRAVAGGCDGGEGGAAGELPADWRQCVVLLGEVGIGNTTAAAALLAALTGAAPEEVVGRGTGVDDAGLLAKQSAVAEALAANRTTMLAQPPTTSPTITSEPTPQTTAARGPMSPALACLRCVGGLELGAMAGAVLECSRLGLPVVVDGFICGAAALAAVAHDPAAARCLLLSHRSAERGAGLLLGALAGTVPLAPHVQQHLQQEQEAGAGQGGLLRPTPAVLDMGMRLGEGTGAVLLLPLLRCAAAVLRDMASLQQVLAAGR